MMLNDAYKAIAELDFEPIKLKLMHVSFGEGWSKAKVDAVEVEYRRFLYLQYANPEADASPTEDVDTFWHYHILDTVKYAEDCDKAFGYFMHHFPYLGLLDSDAPDAALKAANCTRELYEATFGEPYLKAEAYVETAVVSGQQGSASRCMACIVGRPAAQTARCMACIATRPQVQAVRCMACITARRTVGTGRCEPCAPAGVATGNARNRAATLRTPLPAMKQ